MRAENNSTEPRALIIEDEILIAEELRERLSRLGFSVIGTVDSADEGVAIATRERPDVVLMDIRLKEKRTASRQRARFDNRSICQSFTSPPTPIN